MEGTAPLNLDWKTAARRTAFLLLLVIAAGSYLYWAVRDFQAAYNARTVDRPHLERAVSLRPGSAEYRRLLGRYLLFGPGETDAAIAQLKQASELNSYDSGIWFDLAGAYLVAGDRDANRQATERALESNPTSPNVAWEGAVFYIVQREPERSIPHLRTVVEYDPQSAERAFALAWRVFGGPEEMLEITPPIAERNLRLLRFMMEKDTEAGTELVWQRLQTLGEPIPLFNALRYVDFQLQHGEVSKATEAWQSLLGTKPELRQYLVEGNLVVNPGFEYALLGGGLGWRRWESPGATADLDSSEFHSGLRSLKVIFAGQASPHAGIHQYVPVIPGHSYEFRAQVKTDNLISASGPRFVVRDVYSRQILFTSEAVRGTAPWSPVRGEFQAGSETRLVAISIERQPYSFLIKGEMHVDDVELRDKSPGDSRADR